MFYDRKIKYMDVYESGEKVQNAGFVKVEAKGEKVNLQLQISKLRRVDTFECPVVLIGNGQEVVLGTLVLERGRGMTEFGELPIGDLVAGIGYEELLEVQVRLSADRVLRGIVKERVQELAQESEKESLQKTEREPEQKQVQESEAVAGEKQELVSIKMFVEDKPAVERENMQAAETGLLQEKIAVAETERIQEKIILPEEESEPIQNNMPTVRPSPRAEIPTSNGAMKNDKWQQLMSIYPHIRPFEDNREYLMLKPQDFVILSKECFTLSGNSFLLHGYYNYDHLILTKEKRQDGEHFFIGVPGNFYHKEKQVAILFGFESFEGKTEPAGNGDFGYYMISVEI